MHVSIDFEEALELRKKNIINSTFMLFLLISLGNFIVNLVVIGGCLWARTGQPVVGGCILSSWGERVFQYIPAVQRTIEFIEASGKLGLAGFVLDAYSFAWCTALISVFVMSIVSLWIVFFLNSHSRLEFAAIYASAIGGLSKSQLAQQFDIKRVMLFLLICFSFESIVGWVGVLRWRRVLSTDQYASVIFSESISLSFALFFIGYFLLVGVQNNLLSRSK